jgi:hypothetical protein
MKILQIHNFYRTSGDCGVVEAEKEPLAAHGHTVFRFVAYSRERVHDFRFICPNGLFFTKGQICEAYLQPCTAARFIGITCKGLPRVDPVQRIERQSNDCSRLQHANPPLGLILHISLPDARRVRIAATFIIEAFQ